MANEESKSKTWFKVIKLFLEFLIAALTAWFASSCVGWIR